MSAPHPTQESRTLIDELLAEQQRLTAVERFARKHERGDAPAHARYYRDLLPQSRPAAGQQYAFAVDLDACTGCKACVSACHSLNGLEDEELWRNVGFLQGGGADEPYFQTITTACHHCVEPGCLEGCPVMAYEKSEETGIVRHLDDQCIGCQYCVLKCPYDVPKYSAKKGIVRKCDMCANRLSADEAPACVQACPTQAIRIELADKAEVSRAAASGAALVPGAFPSDYTKPTTRFHSARGIPSGARPGDADALRLEHAHWPLIGMLLLTQMSVGIYATMPILEWADAKWMSGLRAPLAASGFAALNLGLLISVFHLGRPLGAWRFFLGLRTSWMSREILAFTIFAAAAAATTVAAFWELIVKRVPAADALPHLGGFALPAELLTALTGAAAVYCSAMIYIDTRRPFWKRAFTLPKFFGSAATLGMVGAACVAAAIPAGQGSAEGPWATVRWLMLAAAVARSALFGWEFQHALRAYNDPESPLRRASATMWKRCPALIATRAAAFLGAVGFAVAAATHHGATAAACAGFALLLSAAEQTIERYFFFTAAAAPRMPGGIAS